MSSPMSKTTPCKLFIDNSKKIIPLYSGNGCVRLVDVSPSSTASSIRSDRTTADFAIAEMARISYGNPDASIKESADNKLINYLVENHHNTPMEGVVLKFFARCPAFVRDHLIRHRTMSFNVMSRRYTPAIGSIKKMGVEKGYYFPPIRIQDTVNKQGSIPIDEKHPQFDKIKTLYDKTIANCKENSNLIDQMTDLGMCREVSRVVDAFASMTEMYFSVNLHNLFHFLELRMDNHSQLETQELANAIYELIKPVVPVACEAFENHRLKSIKFSLDEQKLIPFYYQYIATPLPEISLKIWLSTRSISLNLSDNQLDKFISKMDKLGK